MAMPCCAFCGSIVAVAWFTLLTCETGMAFGCLPIMDVEGTALCNTSFTGWWCVKSSSLCCRNEKRGKWIPW